VCISNLEKWQRISQSTLAAVLSLLAATLLFPFQCSQAANSEYKWSKVDKHVDEMVSSMGSDRAIELLDNPAKEWPPQAALWKFNLLVRRGEVTRAGKMIPIIRRLDPALSPAESTALADYVIGKKEWQLARAILETFPKATPGAGHLFLEHLSKSESVSEVEKWLSAGGRAQNKYWKGERLKWRAGAGLP
jgi:hypothetical protein